MGIREVGWGELGVEGGRLVGLDVGWSRDCGLRRWED